MNAVMQKYIGDGMQVLDRMEKDSLRGSEVSQALLMELMRKNENTEYGKKYGFAHIHSYADYAAKVPLSSYDDYAPYIERMVCFNQKNLLTADDVAYYAHTSGTTGASKLIPCTRKALEVFFSAGYERVFALYDASMRQKTGHGMPSCKGITIMESKIGYTTYGVTHGAISETVLIPKDVPEYNALPEELIYPTADFDRRHLKMLFALRERRLSFIQCSFAPFLHDMIVYLRKNWALLCADTETDPGHYTVLLESDREIPSEKWPYYSDILNRKLCEAHDSYRNKIEQKIMLSLQAKFVQPQTYLLYRDLKVMGGASPNQIKPIHVITDGRLKRFFFGLLQS